MVPAFERLTRVTSDQRLWRRGGKLGVCDRCATVQKAIDGIWHQQIEAIYQSYEIYRQSGGTEQATFDRESGQSSARSASLLKRFAAEFPLAGRGRLLDIGCGNGSFLKAFAASSPGWSLAGTEWDAKDRATVESIPGVEALYTVAPVEVPGRFDLVTMIHVLEHIPSPSAFLAALRAKLNSGGLLVVQLPDHRRNPFELIIADHSSHFTRATVGSLFARCGYEVLTSADDWVPRELTLVARPAENPTSSMNTPDPFAARATVESLIGWLELVVGAARAVAERADSFGLFGTATAASWLAGELGDQVRFFVDEDPSRAGRTHLDRPIYAPSDVPPGSDVFVALPPHLGDLVAQRLGNERTRYVAPPPLPGPIQRQGGDGTVDSSRDHLK
jgi:SAM-dependent methyltransferase